MRKFAVTTALLAVAAFTGSSSLLPDGAFAQKKSISIGTGGPTGVYFVVGQSVCRLVHKAAAEGRKKGRKHGIRCAAPSTAGSTYNIGNIQAGELDFGVVQSDWQFHAYNGSSKFKGRAFKKLRAVFSVHPEPIVILARRDSGIDRYEDLDGKRLNIQPLLTTGDCPPCDSDERTCKDSCTCVKECTSSSSKGKITNLRPTEAVETLCDGKLDAMMLASRNPNPHIEFLTSKCGVVLVGQSGGWVDKMVRKTPFMAKTVIPGGMYYGNPKDVPTYGLIATLVTSADVPEDIVYEVTRAVFENLDDFRKLHRAFQTLDPRRMIKDGLSAPLHPGAVKYYKEKGLM